MKSIVLHLGTTKTGTTSIQAYCANNKLQNHAYYLLDCPENESHWYLVNASLSDLDIGRGPFLLQGISPEPSSFRKDILFQLKNHSNKESNTPIFSSEHFWADFCDHDKTYIRESLDQLKSFLEEAGYIVSTAVIYIRNQIDHIKSDYMQSLKDRNVLGLGEFIDHYSNYTNRYDYSVYIEELVGVFGKSVVKIRPYDILPGAKVDIVIDFLEVIGETRIENMIHGKRDYNTSSLYSSFVCDFLRIFNKSSTEAMYHMARNHPRFILNINNVSSNKNCLSLTESQTEFIKSRYKDSNKKLMDLCGLDLNQLNEMVAIKTYASEAQHRDLSTFANKCILDPSPLLNREIIEESYLCLLRRLPIEPELKHWEQSGLCLSMLVASIIMSSEYNLGGP